MSNSTQSVNDLECNHIACLLDDLSDEDVWGSLSSTDQGTPDENYVLENSNTDQSGKSIDDEFHNDIQQILPTDSESYHKSDNEMPQSMHADW